MASSEISAPDQLAGFAHPRECVQLYGHETARQKFIEALQNGTVHHALLLLGKEGIGKATLAYEFAKLVLSHQSLSDSGDFSDPAFRLNNKDVQLIVNDAHPNLLVLRRSWNPKSKKYAAQISVDNVREVQHFLGNTAGMGKWRVVIVDRADDLNKNAANALLKMLEEPPAYCLFLLLSSEPGKLPSTIRSRCHKLRLDELDEKTLALAVQKVAEQSEVSLPEEEQLSIICQLAKGSVRQALLLASGRTLQDYNEIEQMLDLLPRIDWQKTIELAERLSARGKDHDYHNFIHLLSSRLSSRIREMVMQGAGDKRALAQWSYLWETVTSKKIETDQLNLDRSTFILDLFAHIEETARAHGGLRLKQKPHSSSE